jgi:hypothetical protein
VKKTRSRDAGLSATSLRATPKNTAQNFGQAQLRGTIPKIMDRHPTTMPKKMMREKLQKFLELCRGVLIEK